MTDEEMAENFANNFDYIDNSNYENNYQKDPEKIAYEVYLAGLKAGKPRWHDLRKDPNDLPDSDRYVWTNEGPSCYDSDCLCWRCEFGRRFNVLAWCEPEFEEAKE